MNRFPTYRPGFIFLLFSLFLVQSGLYGQGRPIVTQWAKSFGGSNLDEAYTVCQTNDGGYILGGRSYSMDGHVSNTVPLRGNWMVRIDSLGNILWEKTYGNLGNGFYSIIQTADGGFVACGGGLATAASSQDFYVVKIDAAGNLQWEDYYGGSGSELARCIIQTNDGGYAVVGSNWSYDGDVTDRVNGPYFSIDYWIVKLTPAGSIQWSRSYGGTREDVASSIVETTDGGFAVLGSSSSKDGHVTGYRNPNYSDMWLLKTNASGIIQWQKSYGGGNSCYGYSVSQTPDGGFILGGLGTGNGYDITNYHGIAEYDYWAVKTDVSGNMQWSKCFGGTNNDYIGNIVPSRYGGYLLGGLSTSTDGDVQGSHGDGEYWVLKIDEAGNISWSKALGGTGLEYGFELQETRDGGIIIVGYSTSTDGDITDHINGLDYWVVKLGNKIATAPLTTLQYCPGDSITVKDTLFGKFNTNNTFSIQLSDAAGSFANPQTIAGFPDNSTDSSFRIALPATIPSGNQYRIRVVSNSPHAIYIDNGQNITINAGPALTPGFLGKDTTLCTSSSLNLLAPLVAGYQYRWQDNSSSNQYTATASGNYNVNVTSVSGCSIKDTIQVNIHTVPDFSLGNDVSVCPGEPIVLQPNLPAGNYSWSTGSNASSITAANDGWYWLRVTSNGCSKTDSLLLSTKVKPWINIGEDTIACTGNTFVLDVTNPNASYAWQDGSTQPRITVDRGGIYSVRVSIDGCDTTAQKRVDFVSAPLVALGNDTTLCTGESMLLNAHFAGAEYNWTNGWQQSQLQVDREGTYAVTVSNTCGTASDAIKIEYQHCACFMAMPSAFTPNNDNKNDVFRPASRCNVSDYELKIFNRWGQVVFISRVPQIGWNGQFGQLLQPSGAFVWMMQYKDEAGKMVRKKGTVQLIR